jgi:hypothetical protein
VAAHRGRGVGSRGSAMQRWRIEGRAEQGDGDAGACGDGAQSRQQGAQLGFVGVW